jgi:hypothetical protein
MRVIVFAGTAKERKALDKEGVLRRANVVLTSYSLLERPDGSQTLSRIAWKVRECSVIKPL